jgi:hypothetical protein
MHLCLKAWTSLVRTARSKLNIHINVILSNLRIQVENIISAPEGRLKGYTHTQTLLPKRKRKCRVCMLCLLAFRDPEVSALWSRFPVNRYFCRVALNILPLHIQSASVDHFFVTAIWSPNWYLHLEYSNLELHNFFPFIRATSIQLGLTRFDLTILKYLLQMRILHWYN